MFFIAHLILIELCKCNFYELIKKSLWKSDDTTAIFSCPVSTRRIYGESNSWNCFDTSSKKMLLLTWHKNDFWSTVTRLYIVCYSSVLLLSTQGCYLIRAVKCHILQRFILYCISCTAIVIGFLLYAIFGSFWNCFSHGLVQKFNYLTLMEFWKW